MRNLFYKHAKLILFLIACAIGIVIWISHSIMISDQVHRMIDMFIIITLIFSALYVGEDLTTLYQLANSDFLTGLDNRTYFHHRLEKEIARSRRRGTDLSLIIIDVDNFKVVNDTCGHTAGDETLRELADIMRNSIRNEDTLARIGGEEFTVILPECTLENAKQIAERLRQRVEAEAFMGHKVTISIGVTTLQTNDHRISLFDRADEALYHAKRKRNCVVLAHSDHLEEVDGESENELHLSHQVS